MKIPITVIIITKNEESNIERCIKSCFPASEIFVVDSESNDNTKNISLKYLPKKNVINFKWDGKWPMKKTWALQNLHISNEWVFMLDADEIPTKIFWKEVERKINQKKYTAFMVPLSYYFMGKKIKWGDPIRKLSLFKHKKIYYEKEEILSNFSGFDFEGHSSPIVSGKIGLFKNKIMHFDYKGLDNYIERHKNYARWEANLILKKHYSSNKTGTIRGKLFGNISERRKFMKSVLMRIPLKPIWYFAYSYFFRLGILDGKAGLQYNLFKAFYFLQIELNIQELKNKSSFSN